MYLTRLILSKIEFKKYVFVCSKTHAKEGEGRLIVHLDDIK